VVLVRETHSLTHHNLSDPVEQLIWSFVTQQRKQRDDKERRNEATICALNEHDETYAARGEEYSRH